MKRLFLNLILLAFVLSTPYAMAGGGGSGMSSELQQAWNSMEAKQERDATNLSKLGRDADRAVSATSFPIRQKKGQKIWVCMNCKE